MYHSFCHLFKYKASETMTTTQAAIIRRRALRSLFSRYLLPRSSSFIIQLHKNSIKMGAVLSQLHSN